MHKKAWNQISLSQLRARIGNDDWVLTLDGKMVRGIVPGSKSTGPAMIVDTHDEYLFVYDYHPSDIRVFVNDGTLGA